MSKCTHQGELVSFLSQGENFSPCLQYKCIQCGRMVWLQYGVVELVQNQSMPLSIVYIITKKKLVIHYG